MRSALTILMSAISLALAVPANAQDHCRLHPVVSLPMTVTRSGLITIPMNFAGTRVNMLVDTGSPGSALAKEMAQHLNLDIHDTVFGRGFYGGRRVRQTTIAHKITLANLKMDAFPVGIMPDALDPGAEGLLGHDILTAYDDDFDFAGGRLNFYSTDHCEGRVVYWTAAPVAVVPFEMDGAAHIIVKATLDGEKLNAVLDTGNPRTVADWDTVASYFRLTPSSASVSETKEKDTPGYTYPFKTLSFGGITVNRPDITLVPTALSGMGGRNPTIVIGMNVLRQFHIYVASKENKLYITGATTH